MSGWKAIHGLLIATVARVGHAEGCISSSRRASIDKNRQRFGSSEWGRTLSSGAPERIFGPGLGSTEAPERLAKREAETIVHRFFGST